MSYGIKLNMAMTMNEDGVVEGGVTIKDSENIDVSTEATGNSIADVTQKLSESVVDLISVSKLSPLDKKIMELEKELEELKSQKAEEELEEELEEEECGGDCEDCSCKDVANWNDLIDAYLDTIIPKPRY
jgi:tRNA(Phe) wybutosine-synthesizing methylase Tyw3